MKRVIIGAAAVIGAVLSGAAPASASTGWQIQNVGPKDNASGLLGVSCPAKGNCTAVGWYIRNQVGHSLAEHWDGSRWAIQTLPTPAGTSFALGAVSCPSATACTAAGGSFNGTQQQASIIERWNGTNWALQADAAPAHTKLLGVSSPSAAACTAVGEVWAGQPGTYSKVVAESWDGTGWAVQTVPVPHGTIGAALYAAWCLGTACLHRRRGCQPRRPTGRA